jgi:signal transduction histidine kinase
VARLLGLAYLAKLETKDPTAQDYLEKIQHSAQEMDRILSRLIKTRELSYTEPSIHKINLLTVVENTWQAVAEESDSVGIQFINALNADLMVPTDPDLLGNLLKILLHNSIQYSDPAKDNRFIKVDLEERKKGFVSLRVQDNGIGITPGSEEKIFDMFYVGTDYHNGTGLGLYEATIIVKKLKGRIFLSTSEPQTTCFEIELPKK